MRDRDRPATVESIDIGVQLILVNARWRFTHQVANGFIVVVDECRGTTYGKRRWQHRIRDKIQPGFNLGCEFVAQVKKPATVEWQVTGLLFHPIMPPPRIQGIEKSGFFTGHQCFAGKRKQYVVTAKRAAWRCAL